MEEYFLQYRLKRGMRLWGACLTSPLTPSSFAIQPLRTAALSTGTYSLKRSACAAPTLPGRTPPGTGKPHLTDRPRVQQWPRPAPGRTCPVPPRVPRTLGHSEGQTRPPPPPAHAGGQRGPAAPRPLPLQALSRTRPWRQHLGSRSTHTHLPVSASAGRRAGRCGTAGAELRARRARPEGRGAPVCPPPESAPARRLRGRGGRAVRETAAPRVLSSSPARGSSPTGS